MRSPRVTRRTILIGGGAGIDLLVAYWAWPRQDGSPLRAGPHEAVLGPFLRLAADGRVTLAVPQTEVGQGIWTGLAQIAADELGAAWENMAVEPAPSAPIYSNRLIAREFDFDTRITAGSTSVRAFEQPLREAVAVARGLLCEAAARRWDVNAAECDTGGGFVVHEGKRIAFGEIAEDAAATMLPARASIRAPGTGKVAGKPLPRLDLPAKSDGSFRFTSDVRLPQMLFASVRIAPPTGRLQGFSRENAKSRHGSVDLVARDGWLAAISSTWWAADEALSRASPKFTAIENSNLMTRLADVLGSSAGEQLFQRGNYAAVTEGSRPLSATYSIAPTPHRSLEAPAAVARFKGGILEVWAGTQIPELARAAAANAADMPKEAVTLYPMPVGDGSGSAMDVEAVKIAVELARHANRPVSLAFPPATAQNHDATRPPLMAKVAALPAPNGALSAWSSRIAGMASLDAAMARAAGEGAPKFSPRGATPPYGIDAIRISAIDAGLGLKAGYMRGGDEAALTFITESFIDEMARAMGVEPLAFRMGMLGGAPRLARALSTAAAIGGWDGGAPGSNMGIACASLFGSHIGLLAEASIGANQRVQVSRLVAAVDTGRIINPGLVRQQVEGGLLAALAAATVRAPEWIAGMPRAAPLRGEGFERLSDVPQIDVELIPSDEPPGGVSGLGMAVLAPAVANAIAAGTGRRLRNLPFDPMGTA